MGSHHHHHAWGFTDDDLRLLLTRLPLWRAESQHVNLNVPMQAVIKFRHGLQVYYSKTKDEYDGASQFRAEMNHPGGYSKCEEKFVTQIIEPLMINSFVD